MVTPGEDSLTHSAEASLLFLQDHYFLVRVLDVLNDEDEE
jgi:hypothetical protein